MTRFPNFWGLHAEPPKWQRITLTLLPFILLIAVYLIASHIRLQDNPDDKFLPSPAKMAESVYRMAFTEDQRTGKYLMLEDTLVSLKRLGTGLSLAAVFGLLLGLNMGLFPGLKALMLSFNIFLSIIPPLAVLPILFIIFG